MAAEDSGADHDRPEKQQHPQHISVQHGIAEQNSDQSEGSTRGAQGEVKLLAGAGRIAQQNQQDRGDDDVDDQQNDTGGALSPRAENGSACDLAS
jgi:hypothetical protein